MSRVQIIDLINLIFKRLGHVVPHELEIGVAQQVRDVALPAGEKIIEANNFVSLTQKSFAEMGPQKSGSPGNQNAHGGISPPFIG